MTKAPRPPARRLATLGIALGALVFLSGLLGLALTGGPTSPDASILPPVQLLLGTALVAGFAMRRVRSPHA